MTELPGGYSLPTWQQHARRDDCLDRMVPSDLRQFLGLIERQQQVIDLLMKAVEPVADLEGIGEALIDGDVISKIAEAQVEAERILNHSHPGLEREEQ